MKWSLVNVVRNTLLALSVGVLLPSIASACSMTPSDTRTSDNTAGVWLFIPDAPASLMNSARLLGSISFGDDSLDIFENSAGQFALGWVDNDGDDSSAMSSATSTASTTSNNDPVTPDSVPTPSTPTPEPSSLALLGLGAMALGLAYAGRRLRPTTVG